MHWPGRLWRDRGREGLQWAREGASSKKGQPVEVSGEAPLYGLQGRAQPGVIGHV